MSRNALGPLISGSDQGSDLINKFNAFQDAQRSQHLGSGAPTYAVPGMVWADDTSTDYQFYVRGAAVNMPVFQLDNTRQIARVAMDADRDSYISAQSDDVLGVTLSGALRYRFDASAFLLTNALPRLRWHDSDSTFTAFEGIEYNLNNGAFRGFLCADENSNGTVEVSRISFNDSGVISHRWDVDGVPEAFTITATNADIDSAMEYRRGGVALPFQTAFTSSAQTYVANSTITVPHGLGVAPKNLVYRLVNTTAEGGYTPGNTILLPLQFNRSSGTDSGYSTEVDSTNVTMHTRNDLVLIQHGGGGVLAITSANWDLFVEAWA